MYTFYPIKYSIFISQNRQLERWAAHHEGAGANTTHAGILFLFNVGFSST